MPPYVGDKTALAEERARRARAAVAYIAPGPNLTGARSSGEKAMGLKGAQIAAAPLLLATPRVSTGFVSPAAAARQVAQARTGNPESEGVETIGAPPADADGKTPGARQALGVASTMLAFLANPPLTIASLLGKIAFTTVTTGKPPEKAPIAGPMAVYEMIEKLADKMGGDKAPGPAPESIGPRANEQAGVFTYDLQGNFLSYTNARPDPVSVAPAPGVEAPAPGLELGNDPGAGTGQGTGADGSAGGWGGGNGGSDPSGDGSAGGRE